MRKKALIFTILLLSTVSMKAQNAAPFMNIRLSFLLSPFSPLLTLEVRTIGNLTLQGETNFVHTHGVNLKYYTTQRMEKNYFFVGSAFVSNAFLRSDKKPTTLLYGGYGYAHIFKNNWTFDSRIGIGPTLNADKNSVYPVIKLGAGKRF
jgi:hypothetical protein